jgi:hypothetical protein
MGERESARESEFARACETEKQRENTHTNTNTHRHNAPKPRLAGHMCSCWLFASAEHDERRRNPSDSASE